MLLEGWINGVLKFSYPSATFGLTSGGWDSFELSGYWNTSDTPGSHNTQYRWTDAVVVSTQRVGCLGSTPTPPPPAYTSLYPAFSPYSAFSPYTSFSPSTPPPSGAGQETICSDPNVFFCDNFETRSIGGNDLLISKGTKTPAWSLSSTQTIQVAAGTSFDGTKAMAFLMPACSWTDGQFNGCGTGFGTVPIGKSEFFMRHYVYWAPGYQWSAIADKHIAFIDTAGQRAPWAWHTVWGDREPEHGYEPTQTMYGQNVGTSLTWQTGKWYCLEIHLMQGSGNAIVEGWIDGVKKWNYTNAVFPNAWVDMMISGYWNTDVNPGSRAAQTRYFDNMIMSSQRIGCLGSTTTPPPRIFCAR